MAFIEPMHHNKPNITYLLSLGPSIYRYRWPRACSTQQGSPQNESWDRAALKVNVLSPHRDSIAHRDPMESLLMYILSQSAFKCPHADSMASFSPLLPAVRTAILASRCRPISHLSICKVLDSEWRYRIHALNVCPYCPRTCPAIDRRQAKVYIHFTKMQLAI